MTMANKGCIDGPIMTSKQFRVLWVKIWVGDIV